MSADPSSDRTVPKSAPGSAPKSGDQPLLSIIVVSYDTREMTLACLASVREGTRAAHEVIVVDNASGDGSADAIEAGFAEEAAEGRLRLMRETRNHGFAQANNLAAVRARGEFLLLLNPDTVVPPGALDALLAEAERHPKAGIWGGRTRFADGTLNPTSCWGRMTLWSLFCRGSGLTGIFPRSALFNPEAYGGWARDSAREVDVVTGCLLLIRREFWERLGGFDPRYVMYGEEADLCLRARALGARPRITPEATIIHHGGASEKVRADKVVRVLRAKATLIRAHLPAWQRPLALTFFALHPLTRWIAGTLSGGRTATGEAWAEVWRRRGEWLPGWPPAETGSEKPSETGAAPGA